MGNGHELKVSRYERGRQTYGQLRGAAGRQYGTSGRCSCGDWTFRVNTAPSRGGLAAVRREHAAHLIDAPESVASCDECGRTDPHQHPWEPGDAWYPLHDDNDRAAR